MTGARAALVMRKRILKLSSLRPYTKPTMDLAAQIPLEELEAAGWELVWNERTDHCDAWVVLDGIEEAEECLCPPANTLLICAEPSAYKRYDPSWIQGFQHVVSCQSRIRHQGLRLARPPLPWFVGKGLAELQAPGMPVKVAGVSAVCSNRHNMKGHNQRLRCLRHLSRSFPGKIEWYGRKIRPIANKWDALAPFHFSIAIENSKEPRYWTEKIADCLLAYTVPIYDGAPDLADHLPERCCIRIDSSDPESVARTLEPILNNPKACYESMLPDLLHARRLYLGRHGFGRHVLEFCKHCVPAPRERLRIDPEPKPNYLSKKITQFRRRWLGSS